MFVCGNEMVRSCTSDVLRWSSYNGSLPITKHEKLEQVELEVTNLKDLALASVWFDKEIYGTRS